MNTLKELYKADTYRYVGKLEFYIRFFIFFIGKQSKIGS